jgi:hypothetical protein
MPTLLAELEKVTRAGHLRSILINEYYEPSHRCRQSVIIA